MLIQKTVAAHIFNLGNLAAHILNLENAYDKFRKLWLRIY